MEETRAYLEALDIIASETREIDFDFDQLLDLYAKHYNQMTGEAHVNGDGFEREKEIVSMLQGMITIRAMREHGYRQTEILGISRWERDK